MFTLHQWVLTFEDALYTRLILLANQWSALSKHVITGNKLLSSKILNCSCTYIKWLQRKTLYSEIHWLSERHQPNSCKCLYYLKTKAVVGNESLACLVILDWKWLVMVIIGPQWRQHTSQSPTRSIQSRHTTLTISNLGAYLTLKPIFHKAFTLF